MDQLVAKEFLAEFLPEPRLTQVGSKLEFSEKQEQSIGRVKGFMVTS